MKPLTPFEKFLLEEKSILLIGIPFLLLPENSKEKIIEIVYEQRKLNGKLGNAIARAGNDLLGKDQFIILPEFES